MMEMGKTISILGFQMTNVNSFILDIFKMQKDKIGDKKTELP